MTQTINIKPFAVLALILIVFGVVLPALNSHAIQRHHDGAIRAYNHVKNNGGDHCRWECADGRIRYICPLDNRQNNGASLFAVVVLVAGAAAGSLKLVTAFICRQDYARSIAETGKNPWHITHP